MVLKQVPALSNLIFPPIHILNWHFYSYIENLKFVFIFLSFTSCSVVNISLVFSDFGTVLLIKEHLFSKFVSEICFNFWCINQENM